MQMGGMFWFMEPGDMFFGGDGVFHYDGRHIIHDGHVFLPGKGVYRDTDCVECPYCGAFFRADHYRADITENYKKAVKICPYNKGLMIANTTIANMDVAGGFDLFEYEHGRIWHFPTLAEFAEFCAKYPSYKDLP